MKEFWEDEHFLYDEDEENNSKNIIWQDVLGGIILLSILFFTGYGIVSFIKDII